MRRGLAEFILELSQDCERSMGMGDSGRRYLERHFTPRIIAQEYLKVIRSVV